MLRELKNNPILAQQMRHARWPPLRTALWIAAVLAVGGLILTIGTYAISPEPSSLIIFPGSILFAETILLPLGPLLTALAATVTTANTINSKAYREMFTGQFSERAIVNSSIMGVVFQLRLVWAAAIGLTLPFFVAATHYGVAGEIWASCDQYQRLLHPDSCPPPPVASDILMHHAVEALSLTLSYAVLFMAWNWLGATLGIWTAHLRNTRKAFWAIQFLVVLLIVLHYFLFRTAEQAGWQWLPTTSITAGIDIGLGWLAYRLAMRCVRNKRENAQGIQE